MDNGFTKIPNSILVDTRLSVYDKIIYSLIRMRCMDKDNCWPSLTTLSKDAGISRPKTISSIKKLVEMGLLDKKQERSKNNSSVYTIKDSWSTTFTNSDSKPHLLVNDVYQDGKPHLPTLVNHVYPNNIKQEDKKNKNNNTCTIPPKQANKKKSPPSTYEDVLLELKNLDLDEFQTLFPTVDIDSAFENFSQYCLGESAKHNTINPSKWVNFKAAFRDSCKRAMKTGRFPKEGTMEQWEKDFMEGKFDYLYNKG